MPLNIICNPPSIWETCADQNRLAALYSNIGWLFTEQKEYDKAIEYGNKAYALGN